jgi:hypothetical protein
MENSILAKCWFRDDEFSQFFIALRDARIEQSETASILRQLFGEVMSGQLKGLGDTGFKNPITLSGKREVGDLWKGFGGNTAINAISKIALKRGANISDIKKFVRAYNGERISQGTFIRCTDLYKMATQVRYDVEGQEYADGVVIDGRVVSFMGHKAIRAGRAYFIQDLTSIHSFQGVSVGKMWVKVTPA